MKILFCGEKLLVTKIEGKIVIEENRGEERDLIEGLFNRERAT